MIRIFPYKVVADKSRLVCDDEYSNYEDYIILSPLQSWKTLDFGRIYPGNLP